MPRESGFWRPVSSHLVAGQIERELQRRSVGIHQVVAPVPKDAVEQGRLVEQLALARRAAPSDKGLFSVLAAGLAERGVTARSDQRAGHLAGRVEGAVARRECGRGIAGSNAGLGGQSMA